MTLATFELRMALASQLGGEPTLVIFTVPIMISAYVGGLRPGLFSTLLSYCLASYYLLPPHHTFWVTTPAQRWNIAFVTLAGVIISGLNEALHRARGRAASAIHDRAEMIAANAERELNDLKAAIDAHAIVAITNTKGRITYVNDKFCVISQYAREELVGQDHRIINSGFHPQAFIANLWATISAGRVWNGDIRNRAKDGSFYWVATTIVPYLDPAGKPVQYIAIRADITERKQFEDALQRSNLELESARLMAEKANLAKSEFLSSMSHELRTPLNGIIGFTEFLIDEKPGPLLAKQKEYLTDVLNSGRHLLQLINDVLDLAKIESGKMALHLETFSVRQAVEEVAAVAHGIANQRQISIGLEIGPDLDGVTLDQHKFKQILYNLLSNAIKFSNDGGQVSLRARRPAPAQLEVQIHDTGIGIKAEDMNRLFNAFEQLDSGTARRFEGTGLGLALTKKMIEFQGGRIRAESHPGQGSIFTVVLPVKLEGQIP